VYVVDPFAGFDDNDPTGDLTHVAFNANLLSRGLYVTLFRQRVEDWRPSSVLPIGFAFLDGDHTYRGTVAQVKAAIACGADVIAVHDVNDTGDGREVKRACLESLLGWEERVERLAVWVRSRTGGV
jgi:hypothetical protein